MVLPELVYGNLVRNSMTLYCICAGLVSPIALSAFTIFLICKKPFDAANIGLSFACSSYISKAVGLQDEFLYQKYYDNSLVIAGVISAVTELFFLAFGFKLMQFFS